MIDVRNWCSFFGSACREVLEGFEEGFGRSLQVSVKVAGLSVEVVQSEGDEDDEWSGDEDQEDGCAG